jgi:hypothetical protein
MRNIPRKACVAAALPKRLQASIALKYTKFAELIVAGSPYTRCVTTQHMHSTTTSINHINQPHQSTTSINHINQPHQPTTSTNHINQPHQSTTSINHINQPHQPTTSRSIPGMPRLRRELSSISSILHASKNQNQIQ